MLRECRRLFYPHSHNNYKAGLLQPSGLAVLIGLFLFSQGFLNLFFNFTPGVLGFASDITPEEIVELTNQVRVENGRSSLRFNEQLSEAARQKAADMFVANYWAHTSPQGVDPWRFILNTGYAYLYAGENLARDFATSQGVIDAWMNSPTHRENILNRRYEDIGVAVVDGLLQGQETTLVVQFFATPQKQAAAISRQAAAIEGTQAAVLAKPGSLEKSFEKKPLAVSGFDLTKSLSFAFAGLLLAVLLLDGLVIWRKRAFRIAGPSLAHGAFIIILIMMIFFSRQGMIL